MAFKWRYLLQKNGPDIFVYGPYNTTIEREEKLIHIVEEGALIGDIFALNVTHGGTANVVRFPDVYIQDILDNKRD